MVRSVPRVTWGWNPASLTRCMMWSISSAVALSDMFTIMAMTFLRFVLPPKKMPRFYRGFGGIFELSFLPWRLAPILHLRRECKPIAAKVAKDAKSSH
jgi:hypothetical protein